MQTPLFLTTALALLALPSAHPTARTVQDDTPRPISSDEDRTIGLTFYVPRSVDAPRLIEYAESLLKVKTVSTNDQRPRFVTMESVIGVQGSADERARFIEMLGDLDAQLGDLEKRRAADRPTTLTRSFRLRSLPAAAAADLVQGLTDDVAVQIVDDLGLLVLVGSEANLERVEAVLSDVDRPRPQVRLYVEVIAARDVDAPGPRVGGELTKALSALHPGKAFVSLGRAMVRGSIGGGTPLELASTLRDAEAEGGKRRLTLRAEPTGWDDATRTLSLETCDIRLSEGLQNQDAAQRLSASLALHADEPTVVGSLGGSPLYVVLRFSTQ